MPTPRTVVAAAIIAIAASSAAAAEFPASPAGQRVHDYLNQGRAAEGSLALQADLAADPGNDQLRFATGLMQAIAAVEEVGQVAWIIGAPNPVPLGPVEVRLPPNDSPMKPSYELVRDTAEQLLNGLVAAEATLAPLEGRQVELPVDFGGAHFDFNGNLTADPEEAVLRTFAKATRGAGPSAVTSADPDLRVVFDTADVAWLRGYCHAVAGATELLLAYDERPVYEVIEHRMLRRPAGRATRWDDRAIGELILAIHRARFPLLDAARPPRAHAHFTEMIRLGGVSWDAITAETDDRFEWIPNPRQSSVTGARVSEEMVVGWRNALAGAAATLDGRQLIPHWTSDRAGTGVNLRKLLTEPRDFDLVEFIIGPGAEPYLEEGTIANPAEWRAAVEPFGRNLPGYFLWFN